MSVNVRSPLRYTIQQTVAPAEEPITVAELRDHLRIEHTDDDTQLSGFIKAAREWGETFTGRQFVTATWQLKLLRFFDQMLLPRPPLGAVSSITYLDTGGSSQTLATSVYDVYAAAVPAVIALGYSQSWPATRDTPAAVTITYTAGYGVPSTETITEPSWESIRQGMLATAGALYEYREALNSTPVADVSRVGRAYFQHERVWFDLPWLR